MKDMIQVHIILRTLTTGTLNYKSITKQITKRQSAGFEQPYSKQENKENDKQHIQLRILRYLCLYLKEKL